MKKINFIFLLLLLSISAFSQTNVSGGILTNTTWSKVNSPYIVTGNISVYSGATLNIEPGVVVKFNKDFSIRVQGTLNAIGNLTDKIIFTNSNNNNIDWIGSNGTDLSSSSWGGIFLDNSQNSTIKFCIIKNANIGVKITDDLDSQYPIFSESIVINCFTGISVLGNRNSKFFISKNKIVNNFEGIKTYMADTFIESNVIADNRTGLIVSGGPGCGGDNLCNNSSPTIRKNSICNNLFSTISIVNSSPIIENNTICTNNTSSITVNKFSPTINTNNFITTSTNNSFVIRNNGDKNINAASNFWLFNNQTIIQTSIASILYDNLDNMDSGIISFLPLLSNFNLNNPVSAPINFSKTKVGSDLKFTWTANSETDVVGYKLYYGTPTGHSYSNVIDLGNKSSYTLTNGDSNSEYALTAYDSNIDNNNDQIDGNESWFSVIKSPTPTSIDAIESLENELYAYPNPAYSYFEILIPTNFQTNNILVQVINSIGKTVINKEYEIIDNKILMPIGHLSKGLYMIKVKTDKTKTLKIIKI